MNSELSELRQRVEILEALLISLYTNFLVFFDSTQGSRDDKAQKNMLESMRYDKEIIKEIVRKKRGESSA